jgi:2-polyprenyl-3-methyl-5-hydroxy-6-metoxy-1,4-benzoquinol methylase
MSDDSDCQDEEDVIMSAMPAEQKVDIDEEPRHHHVCPWWVGYLITNPLRKLGEDPDTILAPLARPGMTAIDIGCGMGFFSLSLARLVGDSGRVICVDVQQKMLSNLERRARRKGLSEIIECRLASQEDVAIADLGEQADLVLAVHVLHETAYPRRFLTSCIEALRAGGKMLILEPKGHVSDDDFQATVRTAFEVGFVEAGHDDLKKSRAVVLEKVVGRQQARHHP